MKLSTKGWRTLYGNTQSLHIGQRIYVRDNNVRRSYKITSIINRSEYTVKLVWWERLRNALTIKLRKESKRNGIRKV
jgi:sortase (surface protein transpeptidase)